MSRLSLLKAEMTEVQMENAVEGVCSAAATSDLMPAHGRNLPAVWRPSNLPNNKESLCENQLANQFNI